MKRMFEILPDMAGCTYPSKETVDRAFTVEFKRYLDYMAESHEALVPLSFAQFLLADSVLTGFDSFLWPKDTLVKIRSNGMIGIVTGWVDVGCSAPVVAVRVRTAKNEGKGSGFHPSDLERADIPPEVLEYVAGTLKDRVHGKVDEAFEGDGDGQ